MAIPRRPAASRTRSVIAARLLSGHHGSIRSIVNWTLVTPSSSATIRAHSSGAGHRLIAKQRFRPMSMAPSFQVRVPLAHVVRRLAGLLAEHDRDEVEEHELSRLV